MEVPSTYLSKYVQDADGVIYKVMPEHLLKLSPWKDGEDRRVIEKNFDGYSMITYKNACMIVNSQFASINEEWEHNGKKYLASAIPENADEDERSYFLSTLPSHKVVLTNAKAILGNDGISSVCMTNDDGSQELKMVKHKGKIYYILIINEFLPRVQAYNTFGEFCQWIGIKDCKPIFCKTDKRYI